jgi:prepilin-type N-terminal cleavage/methylation domain-containing protein
LVLQLSNWELAMMLITDISPRQRIRRQYGFSLIELMIAMFILMVGLLGGMIIIIAATAGNARSRFDTAAVALAQSTMDRILVVSNSASNLNSNITDCNGNTYTVNTAPGGATLADIASGSNGFQSIDFSQPPVIGYQMLYTLCATGLGQTGVPQTYDVRWRVDSLTTLNSSSQIQMVSVAAKNVGTVGNGFNQAQLFVMPITLRALRGN